MLQELLLPIVNVLLQTLITMKHHGINIVIVNHGSVIHQITQQIVVIYLLHACQTVLIVLIQLAVIIVSKTTSLMVLIVNGKILLLYAQIGVILVLLLIGVTNVLLDLSLILLVLVTWI